MSNAERRRMAEIIRLLKRTYPEARCSLDYANPYQLLVATILSAQCTDERVNQVTPILFQRLGTPEKMAKAPLGEIEKIIRPTGFFKAKAKALKESARMLVDSYGGEVPADIEKLVQLRGVGRKTANVVLGNVFHIPAIVVDTHVTRLSIRMGLTRPPNSKDPVKIEQDLMKVVHKEDWTLLSHLFIHHGRAICTARKALCEECPINRYCPKIGVK